MTTIIAASTNVRDETLDTELGARRSSLMSSSSRPCHPLSLRLHSTMDSFLSPDPQSPMTMQSKLEIPDNVVNDLVAKLTLKKKIHALFDAIGLDEELYAEQHIVLSRLTFTLTFVLICTSVIVFTVESLPEFYGKDLPVFFVIESLCIGWFTLEMVIRFATTTDKREFVYDKLNWVDIASILPYYIDLILLLIMGAHANGKGLVLLRVVRLTRMFRVFKLSKYNEGIQVVGAALKNSSDALSLLLFLTTITVVLFGSGIFFAEQAAADFDEENRTWVRKDEFGGPSTKHPFKSIPHSFWWCLVTVTTVGYGDMYPVTFPGYMVGACAMLAGLLIVAFPIIILGANFSEARETQARLKEEDRLCRMRIIHGNRQSVADDPIQDFNSVHDHDHDHEHEHGFDRDRGQDNNSSKTNYQQADVTQQMQLTLLNQILKRLDTIEGNMAKMSRKLDNAREDL